MTDQQKHLIESIISGDIESIKKVKPHLIKQGFDFSFENNWPLILAIIYGHLEIVKILVNDFNISIEDIAETEAFYRACGKGRVDVIRYLTEHSDAFKYNSRGLSVAIGSNHQEIIDLLFSYKEDFNGAACTAAQLGRKDLLQIIFDHDFHLKDNSYKRALNWAADKKRWDTAKYMIDNNYLKLDDLGDIYRHDYQNYLTNL